MKEEDFTTLMTIALTVTVIVDDSHFEPCGPTAHYMYMYMLSAYS